MNTQKIETYKGFEIISFSEGFKISGGTLNTIVSYIVRNEKIVSGFAFGVGMLERMTQPHIEDEELLTQATEIIRNYIDNKLIKHLEEYTFEFHSSQFIDVNNPGWWIKSLKKNYGKR